MNNEQIDNTDYYRLPSGRQLEDFIAEKRLSFAEGSALKYLYRAGKKDGESAEKDRAKAEHYIRFIARRVSEEVFNVRNRLHNLLRLAEADNIVVGFLPGDTLRCIGKHYVKATQKHPYFCDRLLNYDGDADYHLTRIQNALQRTRSALASKEISGEDVLTCEILEAIEAFYKGDTENAVDECYDAIAVLLRIIDVLYGRQPLGKPKEGAE